MRRTPKALLGLIVVVVAVALVIFYVTRGPRPGHVKDEALRGGRTAASFTAAAENYFKDMDNGISLSEDEVKGRNMWIVWTGGNDRFWDVLIKDAFGTFDLLKTISSAPGLKFSRDNRWSYLGLVNEPCFDKATGPDPKHFGLWLDQRRPDCPNGLDPFADERKYPGVKIGARGENGFPIGSYYGEPTGIVGLRLFPNPDFNEAARRRWDPKRFYDDPSYYEQKDLVRPFRVGMSCGFCHVGPSPIHPPADPEHPQWADLNSTVGAQYFWFDRVFVWGADESNYIFQLLHTYKPGTLDTSLVSSDSIVNPRTMNALYQTKARLFHAKPYGRELLTGGQLDNKQFNDFPDVGELETLYEKPYVFTPRVLKDGSDSVGALGALNRVYLNIGLFSEEWLLHFAPFTGAQRLSPIRIADAERNSVYWQATEQQTLYMAKFLLTAGRPDLLAKAPQGTSYQTADQAIIDRGKTVFAERCARCHSSKLPMPVVGMEGPGAENCNGRNYLTCWNRYWAWTKTAEFKAKMTEIVKKEDFLKDNYLSSEFRIPATLLQTNSCSPVARNALANNIWDNFSSQSYKDLPSVGDITVKDPFTGKDRKFTMPAGGRGFTRPPSLVSLWSTAPFLQNNSVGPFDPDPSVAARMKVFNASIEQMLWPEKRTLDTRLGDRGVGQIDRTTATSWVKLPAGFVPWPVRAMSGLVNLLLPGTINAKGDLQIGPIPKGTPVGLLGNFDPLPEQRGMLSTLGRTWKLLELGFRLRHDLAALPKNPDDATAARIFQPLGHELYELGNCQDPEVNRGHYFGTDRFAEEPGLSDSDKHALIEFLKTF